MSVGIQNGNVAGTYLIRASLTPAAVSASRVAGQNFTATQWPALANLKAGDFVQINSPVITTSVNVSGARVSTNGVLTVYFTNATAGVVTPSPGVYQLLISRPESGVAATGISD